MDGHRDHIEIDYGAGDIIVAKAPPPARRGEARQMTYRGVVQPNTNAVRSAPRPSHADRLRPGAATPAGEPPRKRSRSPIPKERTTQDEKEDEAPGPMDGVAADPPPATARKPTADPTVTGYQHVRARLELEKIPGDGNCMWRAFHTATMSAVGTFKNADDWAKTKARLVAHMSDPSNSQVQGVVGRQSSHQG